MNREKEQQQRLIELLGLVIDGLKSERLHLVPGWDSSLQFRDRHLSRVILDLRFDVPADGAQPVLMPDPSGGSGGGAFAVAYVAGVDVAADGMSVTIYGDGTGVALPSVSAGLRTCMGHVSSTQQVNPPMGPPASQAHAGNSTPASASVRGPQKSERYGERESSEVNALAARRSGK